MPKDDVLPTSVAGRTPSDPDRAGYRRPPKHSRFKPGQSGNPSGRPKNRPSFSKELIAKLSASVPKGEESKWAAMCENLANAGVANVGVALKLVSLVIAMFKENTHDDGELTAQQTALVNDFEARQELAESATQSNAEQLTTKHFGDNHEQEIS